MKYLLEFALFINATFLGSSTLQSLAQHEYRGQTATLHRESSWDGARETTAAMKFTGQLNDGSSDPVESKCPLYQVAGDKNPENQLAEAKGANNVVEERTEEAGGPGAKFRRANHYGLNPSRDCLRFVSFAYADSVERQHAAVELPRSSIARTTPSVVAPAVASIQSLWDDQNISRQEADQIFSDPSLRSDVLNHPQAVDMMRSAMRSDPNLKSKMKNISDSPRLARGILMTPVGKTSWGYQGMGMTAPEADKLIAIAQQIISGGGYAKK